MSDTIFVGVSNQDFEKDANYPELELTTEICKTILENYLTTIIPIASFLSIYELIGLSQTQQNILNSMEVAKSTKDLSKEKND